MADKRRLTQRLLFALCPLPCALRYVQADEPLGGCQEDDRIVAAPAVRVLVRERRAVPQPAPLLERLLDVGVRVEHALAGKQADRVVEMPARPDRRVDVEAVLEPRVEVVGAVAGSGVHGPGARVERHVAGQHADRIAVVQRVPESDAFELRALHARDRARRARGRRSAPPRARAVPRAARRGRPPRTPRSRSPDETRPPGSTGSSTGSSSRSGRTRRGRRAPAHARRARPRSPAQAGTRRRSTATSDPRTRFPPRPAPCGSGCTSAPASCAW